MRSELNFSRRGDGATPAHDKDAVYTIALAALMDPSLLSAADVQNLGRAFVAHEEVRRERESRTSPR